MLSYITQDQIFNLPQTMASLEESFDREILQKMSKPELFALKLTSKYLEKMMLTEATLPFFEFHSYTKDF